MLRNVIEYVEDGMLNTCHDKTHDQEDRLSEDRPQTDTGYNWIPEHLRALCTGHSMQPFFFNIIDTPFYEFEKFGYGGTSFTNI